MTKLSVGVGFCNNQLCNNQIDATLISQETGE